MAHLGILFDTAKAATWVAPDALETLFAQPSYEARMTAFCILDFQARKRVGDPELRDTYLRHHDRIRCRDGLIVGRDAAIGR